MPVTAIQFGKPGAHQRMPALPFAHFSTPIATYEPSGECMLLFRGRRFFMPDLHPYFRDIAEAFEWYFRLEEKLLEAAAMAKSSSGT